VLNAQNGLIGEVDQALIKRLLAERLALWEICKRERKEYPLA
jgi:hypothetical protein